MQVNKTFPRKQEKVRNKPWAFWLEIRRLVALPYIRSIFAMNGVPWGSKWAIYGSPLIQRFHGSQILIGKRVQMRSWPSSNPLSPNHPVVLATRSSKAIIKIGNQVGLTGATLVAALSIEIGNRVTIGSNSTIVDTDFHSLNPNLRQDNYFEPEPIPVIIEDDVFIGIECLILKGVRIGSQSVIGAGSVVVDDVPSRCLAAGNPARVIKEINFN